MKLSNGYESIHKLPGKRRKPYRVRKTAGREQTADGKVIQKYEDIGCCKTKAEVLQALVEYNTNPHEINASKITFKEVYTYPQL